MFKIKTTFFISTFFCGLILIGKGLVGYNYSQKEYNLHNKTSTQINNLYSEKEILLKDPPVSEVLSEKIIVKIKVKPLNPNIISNIENKNDVQSISNLTDKDLDHLSIRKKEFVKVVLPIIINENQNILSTRSFVIDLKKKLNTFKTLNNSDIKKLNNIAKKYNIKHSNKHKLDLINEILNNVDIIPNSIVLAQAAIESGWGKSRFARDHNALFGEYTYDQDKGVLPLKRDLGAKHFIKSFSSYDNSVASYFNNINSHNAYKDFRLLRQIMRSKNNFSDILLLVNKLDSYAEDNNYIDTLSLVIKENKFDKFDSKTIFY